MRFTRAREVPDCASLSVQTYRFITPTNTSPICFREYISGIQGRLGRLIQYLAHTSQPSFGLSVTRITRSQCRVDPYTLAKHERVPMVCQPARESLRSIVKMSIRNLIRVRARHRLEPCREADIQDKVGHGLIQPTPQPQLWPAQDSASIFHRPSASALPAVSAALMLAVIT